MADALDAATMAPTPRDTTRTTLRHAAAAVLAAWDDQDNRDTDIIAALETPMATLRTMLAEKAPRPKGNLRKGTKQEAVLTMLRRTEGATIAQIMETTAWASHTVWLPGRAEEEGHQGRYARAGADGRGQGGRERIFLRLSHRLTLPALPGSKPPPAERGSFVIKAVTLGVCSVHMF